MEQKQRSQNSLQEYEFLLKNAQENVKQLEQFSHLLSLFQDTEKSIQKQLQKQLNSTSLQNDKNPEYGKIFELLKIYIESKFQDSQDLYKSYKSDQEGLQKTINLNKEKLKLWGDEIKQMEKDSINQYTKLQKLKEKYYKESRDLEQNFIFFKCADLNQESSSQMIQKLQTKVYVLISDRQDTEEQHKVQNQLHSFQASRLIEQLEQKNKLLQELATHTYKATYQIFDNVIYKNRQEVDNDTRFLNYAQAESSATQEQHGRLFKDMRYQYSIIYEPKNFINIRSWKKYRTFLSDYVEQGLYKMSQNKNPNNFTEHPEENGFINQEFKDILQNYFKLYLDQFISDPSLLQQKYHKCFPKIQQEFQEELEQKQQQQIQQEQQQQEQQQQEQQQQKQQQQGENEQNTNIQENRNSINEKESQEIPQEGVQQQQEQIIPDQIENPDSSQDQQQVQNSENVDNNEQFLKQLQDLENELILQYGDCMLKEDMIKNIGKLSSQIFYYTHPQIDHIIPKQYIEYIYHLFKKKFYRNVIVSLIQSYRSFGKMQFDQIPYQNVLNITNLILTSCKQEKDTENSSRMMVMTCTLYTKQENQTIYIQENIMNHNLWKCIDLWESLVYISIEDDMSKQLPKTKRYDTNEFQMQYKNLIQSNLMSIAINMQKFKISKENIKELLRKFALQYGLFEIQIQELLKFIDDEKFGDGISSISVLNSYYQNESTIRQQQNQAELTNIEENQEKQQNVAPRIFSFGGSLPKDKQ